MYRQQLEEMKMINQEVIAKLLRIHDLPTLPEVMSKVLETVEDENASAATLTRLLECDHAISARILRLANSAFYGLRYRSDSIQRAVIVIGMEAVKELALATSVFDAFMRRNQFALKPEDFWMHSLGTAKAAELLCQAHVPQSGCKPCFTGGLLHDMGKYVLAIVLQKEYRDVLHSIDCNSRALSEAEKEKLGTTHAEVGAWLAEHWGFPPVLRDIIENHHEPLEYEGPNKFEVLIVALANNVAQESSFGKAGERSTVSYDSEILQQLGVTHDELGRMVVELDEVRNETSQFLSILKGSGRNGAG